jgi:uncharacterized membrane protein YbhN (UPF0104 family)
MERVIDILVLCLLAIAGSLYIGNQTTALLAAFALIFPIGALLLLIWADKVPLIGKKLFRLAVACRTVFKNPWLILLGCLLAFVCWSAILVIMYCLFLAVGAGTGFTVIVSVTPLAILVGLFPVSISGMGTRDAAMAYLLSGIEKETIYAGTFLYTVATYWFLALLGLIFLGRETLRMTTTRVQATQDALKKATVKNR